MSAGKFLLAKAPSILSRMSKCAGSSKQNPIDELASIPRGSLYAKRERGKLIQLCQQVVSAAAGDFSPNEFAHWSRLRQNDARIDIWRIGFGPRNVRLIDQ